MPRWPRRCEGPRSRSGTGSRGVDLYGLHITRLWPSVRYSTPRPAHRFRDEVPSHGWDGRIGAQPRLAGVGAMISASSSGSADDAQSGCSARIARTPSSRSQSPAWPVPDAGTAVGGHGGCHWADCHQRGSGIHGRPTRCDATTVEQARHSGGSRSADVRLVHRDRQQFKVESSARDSAGKRVLANRIRARNLKGGNPNQVVHISRGRGPSTAASPVVRPRRRSKEARPAEAVRASDLQQHCRDDRI